MKPSEVFLSLPEPRGAYTVWLVKQMQAWAQASGREAERVEERAKGYHLPVVSSPEHHKAFDRWLTKQFAQGAKK